MVMGRPTKFSKDIKEKILKMAECGLTDRQVAYICGVTEQTVNNWKVRHSDFFESLKIAKEIADIQVEQSLYKKATGQLKITEIHEGVDANGNIVDKKIVKEVAPSDTSCIFWLKNRQPDKWRDTHNVDVDISDISFVEDD